jgi:hypothetical protein
MKRLFLLLGFILVITFSNAQNNPYVVDGGFEPMTMDEMLLPFVLYSQNAERIRELQEQREAAAKQRFSDYSDKAYECFNKSDYQGFIYYSSLALNTGWYNSEMYYDRGRAFEELHDYKQAKKQYKIALGYGYYPAQSALQLVKVHKKEWKQSQK